MLPTGRKCLEWLKQERVKSVNKYVGRVGEANEQEILQENFGVALNLLVC